ncbi:PilZ domain-containing protein [Sessilibacter sp. MAH2]
MDERRRFERRPTSIRVELTHPTFGTMVGYAKDISDGGASVMLDVDVKPPVGTEVSVVFRKVSGVVNDNPVKMKVMHQQRNIVGLMFTGSLDTQIF